ncbi:MAG TPA: transporter [Candidatus Sulfotelmatobacter sp.]|nr:transporter [Candidatus Sulfotelmatobacter sp.]
MTREYASRSLLSKLCKYGAFLALTIAALAAPAQDLAPRAYLITPVHSNAAVFAYSFLDGNLVFDNAVPITGATARVSIPVFTYYHSLSFFGRSANVTASLPYGVGNVRGNVLDQETTAYRSGLFDAVFRFSVNVMGGPAMNVADFRKWRQKTIMGVSLRVVTPTGQYDPTKLINYGANRWGFKPEFGLSRRWGYWVLDAYSGVWFYTTNHDFFSRNQFSPGTNMQKQNSIFAFEGHLSYDVKPRLWASLDGNFWVGGRTRINGVESPNSLQENSRIGGTVSVPVNKHQSLKFSYNRGAYIRYGGNFNNISVGWQYSWLGRPN